VPRRQPGACIDDAAVVVVVDLGERQGVGENQRRADLGRQRAGQTDRTPSSARRIDDTHDRADRVRHRSRTEDLSGGRGER